MIRPEAWQNKTWPLKSECATRLVRIQAGRKHTSALPKHELHNLWQIRTENERRKSRHTERKGRENPKSLGFLSKREGGGGIFHSATVRQLRPVQYSTKSGGWSPVLNPFHCLRAAIIVFTIVCGWGKKKKRREQRGEKKTCPFVWKGPSRKVILWLFEFATKARLIALDCTHIFVHSACLCCLTQESHMSVLLRPANSDTRASLDDESRRQTGLHEYWCGG